MTDVKSDKLYAGKVIAKSRLAKGNQKDKVRITYNISEYESCINDDGDFSLITRDISRS